MERVHRAKEKEKDVITGRLHDMTDEEREVDNLFKNSKLGVWSKGLQKGHRIYQQDTYDQEREAMEKQALVELRMGENNFVTDMNEYPDLLPLEENWQKFKDAYPIYGIIGAICTSVIFIKSPQFYKIK